jgi:hypothetical protein
LLCINSSTLELRGERASVLMGLKLQQGAMFGAAVEGYNDAMPTAAALNPSQQQILIHLGNRDVVFGPLLGLPGPLNFYPGLESQQLPRIADESEVDEARIVETLRVFGMKKTGADGERFGADLRLIDDAGNSVLIDIKIRERDPRSRDFNQVLERIKDAARSGETLQVWFINVERLKLSVVRLDGSLPQLEELVPIDVWEETSSGVFRRAQVVDEIQDWEHRVSQLYRDVRAWLSEQHSFRYEENRTVTMSEELMRKFAVPDRELRVLDVISNEKVLISFVPRGLWLIGSWGRVDAITPEGTAILVAIRHDDETFEWRVTSSGDRPQLVPFDRDSLLALVPRL